MNFSNFLLDASEATQSGGTLSTILSLSPMLVLFAVFYFFLLRPQKKQEKEMKAMREGVSVGDCILTTGGIVGVVVKVKDDMMLIESGADRTKLQIKTYAVQQVLAKAGEENSEK